MKKVVVTSVILILALSNLFFAFSKKSSDNTAESQNSQYPFLANRIFQENHNDIILNFVPVRTIIESTFSDIPEPNSVYFEYLPTGTSVRSNSENQLIAASLVKLPVVMNLYRAVELEKIDLTEQVQLIEEDLDPEFGTLYQRGAGYALTLREAARLALTESDNTAQRLINRRVRGLLKLDEESMRWLDIDYAIRDGESLFNSRSFSSMLKCLYFSCYLKPDASQEILSFLSQSNYNDRLTRDLPDTALVAHKFGYYDERGTHSDCGIFYVPKRPYVLCIMMQGNEQAVNQIIAQTSKNIFDTVSRL